MADSSSNNQDYLGGLMGIAEPSLLTNLGLGLMSAAKYGGNVGDGISHAIQNYQQQKLASQQFQGGQLDLMRQKMLLGAAMNEFRGQQGAPSAVPNAAPPGAQPQQGSPQMAPAPQGMPSGVSASPQPQAAPSSAPSWLTPPSQGDIYGASVPGFPSSNYISRTALLSNHSPLPELTGLHEQQLKTAQAQFAPVIGRMDTLNKSDKPTQYMQADPEFSAAWPALAQKLGLDPVKDLNDPNVRTAFTFARNNLASSLSEPTVEPPVQMRPTSGEFGYRGQVNPVNNKEEQVQGRSLPEYSSTDVFDPKTGKTTKQFQQTGGWFGGSAAPAGAPSPALPKPAGAVNPAPTRLAGAAQPAPPSMRRGPQDVDLGLGAPNTDQTRAAGLAMSMRTGLENIRKLEQGGFNLTPSDRAAIVGVISEQGGPLGSITGGALSSLPLQELLAHKLSSQGQQYLAGLMPVLQGIGHHLGGQRLNDVQIKALLESVAPINTQNKAAMAQINSTRDGYYSGLLAEAGGARDLSVFGGALKSDYDNLSRGAQGGPAPGAATEGATSTSKSGKPIIFQNGHWQYASK